MRAEGYSAPSGGDWVAGGWGAAGISWDSVSGVGGVGWWGLGVGLVHCAPPPRYSVCATARHALRCWRAAAAACVGVARSSGQHGLMLVKMSARHTRARAGRGCATLVRPFSSGVRVKSLQNILHFVSH